MIPFLPGEIADIRKLFHPLGRPSVEFLKCRVVKQVLYNNPAYRVAAIPGQWHDPDARHYEEWEWVVDGVWMSVPPANVDEETWDLLVKKKTVTVEREMDAYRDVVVDGEVKWKNGTKLVDRNCVRNGSPFGRVGRKTQVVRNLPSNNFMSGNHHDGYGYVKRFQWLKKNSILVRTDTIALRKNDSGGWQWSVGLTRLAREDDDERISLIPQTWGAALSMRTHEDDDEKSTSIPQAPMGGNRESGDPECVGTGAGGEPPFDTEGNFAEGDSPVGVQEEGDDFVNLQDVREVED